jgi:secreted trypsin-like serine protease
VDRFFRGVGYEARRLPARSRPAANEADSGVIGGIQADRGLWPLVLALVFALV